MWYLLHEVQLSARLFANSSEASFRRTFGDDSSPSRQHKITTETDPIFVCYSTPLAWSVDLEYSLYPVIRWYIRYSEHGLDEWSSFSHRMSVRLEFVEFFFSSEAKVPVRLVFLVLFLRRIWEQGKNLVRWHCLLFWVGSTLPCFASSEPRRRRMLIRFEGPWAPRSTRARALGDSRPPPLSACSNIQNTRYFWIRTTCCWNCC